MNIDTENYTNTDRELMKQNSRNYTVIKRHRGWEGNTTNLHIMWRRQETHYKLWSEASDITLQKWPKAKKYDFIWKI